MKTQQTNPIQSMLEVVIAHLYEQKDRAPSRIRMEEVEDALVYFQKEYLQIAHHEYHPFLEERWGA